MRAALALRPAANAPRIVRVPSTESGIELQALTLYTPESGTRLCAGLDLRVKAGESLLIVGPSGCGKSSLLRAIAGAQLPGLGSGFSLSVTRPSHFKCSLRKEAERGLPDLAI